MSWPDLAPEQQNLIVIATATIREAERLVESCEQCNPVSAAIPFDWTLDRITGSDSTITDYIMETPAHCPNCRRAIFEKTLVEPVD